MKRILLIAAIALSVSAAIYQLTIPVAIAQDIDDNSPLANTEGGRVEGKTDGRVVYFLGIPFAQPPVGELRWRAPQPVKPWTGILKTTEFKPDPPQERKEHNTSEDCLYLNVFRPAVMPNRRLPVMVWIYGGALANGGASIYPGQFLAEQGIIVVTFNYRLGRLGFFAHPALAAEQPGEARGNYGYMDQIAALKWVKKNIASFGGNPKNVTIAGESAGGGSVLVMLTSPMARGLFQKAILESPGLPSARADATPMRPLYDAEGIAIRYAESLGIKGDDGVALERLRAIPVETLAAGSAYAATAVLGGPEVPGISHSIIDGELVPDAPEAILRAGAQTKVPIIVGANNRDLAYSVAEEKYDLYSQLGTLAPKARRLYEPKGNMPIEELIQHFIADEIMVEPSRNLADLMTKAGQPAWFYRFSYVPEANRATNRGALHAMELPFTFNAPNLLEHPTPADREMAAAMSAYWVSFIQTGDPNNDYVLAQWPRYDRIARQVLNFTNYGIVYGHDPIQDRLDLWQSYHDNARVIAKNRER